MWGFLTAVRCFLTRVLARQPHLSETHCVEPASLALQVSSLSVCSGLGLESCAPCLAGAVLSGTIGAHCDKASCGYSHKSEMLSVIDLIFLASSLQGMS